MTLKERKATFKVINLVKISQLLFLWLREVQRKLNKEREREKGKVNEICMVVRLEDNETHGDEVLIASQNMSNLYPHPSAPDHNTLDQSSSGRLTRSRGTRYMWSQAMEDVTPKLVPVETVETYPMVEVANPSYNAAAAAADGTTPTILVFRTWTMEDVKKGSRVSNLTQKDPNQCCQDYEPASSMNQPANSEQKHRPSYGRDLCCYCKKISHWAVDCPEIPQSS